MNPNSQTVTKRVAGRVSRLRQYQYRNYLLNTIITHKTHRVPHHLTSKKHPTSRTARRGYTRPLTSSTPTFDKNNKTHGYREEHAGSMRRAYTLKCSCCHIGTYCCGYARKRIRGRLPPRKD